MHGLVEPKYDSWSSYDLAMREVADVQGKYLVPKVYNSWVCVLAPPLIACDLGH